jgi:hypothetical protein
MTVNRRIWGFTLAGHAAAEFLVTSTVSLPEPALEITEVAKTVLVDSIDTLLGSLILQGRLRLRWVYAAPSKVSSAAHPILSTAVETPYIVRVSANKATSEMQSLVESAHVQDGRTEILQRDGRGGMATIRDHSILVLTARYGKHEEIDLHEPQGLVTRQVPQRPVISHFGTHRRSSR